MKKISFIEKLFKVKKKENNCCSFEIEEIKEESSCSKTTDEKDTCCKR